MLKLFLYEGFLFESLKVRIGQLARLKSTVIEPVALNSAVSKCHRLSVIVCSTTKAFTTQIKQLD